MQHTTELTGLLNIKYPIILAPMFLVSNVKMTLAALDSGITAAIPALNYRTDKEFRTALDELKSQSSKPFGINLIVNRSNYRLKEQLRTCLDYEVPYIITSLGNPKKIIDTCRPKGIKIISDISDVDYADKAVKAGADALIALNDKAGGHKGHIPAQQLIPELKKRYDDIPIISAGGIGNGSGIKKMLDLGACGLSMGSIFIASREADVSQEYKQAIVDYGAKDIVISTKISGIPCHVINTPYVQKIGTKQNLVERILSGNKTIKKYTKILTFLKGMKALERAAFSATYKTVWVAGPSIQYVDEIQTISEIVKRLIREWEEVGSLSAATSR